MTALTKSSSCCGAPVQVGASDEGTNYYLCIRCKEPCDLKEEMTAAIWVWEKGKFKYFAAGWDARDPELAEKQKEIDGLKAEIERLREALEIIAQGQNDPIGTNSDIAKEALRPESADGRDLNDQGR